LQSFCASQERKLPGLVGQYTPPQQMMVVSGSCGDFGPSGGAGLQLQMPFTFGLPASGNGTV
jgi:hypothetical protein